MCPTEVRGVKPRPHEWARLRTGLDTVHVWDWPRRWSPRDGSFIGKWTVGIKWDGRVVGSTGPIGVAEEVDVVLGEVGWLIGGV
jgi:hypothetical protein